MTTISNLKKQYYKLESKTLVKINSAIEKVGSTRQLSKILYNNEDTLASILFRCKKSSPYKLAKLLKTLEEINEKITPSNSLVKKKARGNAV